MLEPTAASAAPGYIASAIFMDTLVNVEVTTTVDDAAAAEAAQRAFAWFAHVEKLCTRFDSASDLSRISSAPPGTAVLVDPLVFDLLDFALSVAEASGGAFDPTVGRAMQAGGFTRNYRTGEEVASPSADPAATSADIVLDRENRTVTLTKPLVLDLGAVAKGFATDLAGQELLAFPGFVIDAGGDVLAHGVSPDGGPWRIGIRHPRELDTVIDTLSVSDAVVCTSGDYERRASGSEAGHHLLDPQTGRSVEGVASVTVVAPNAMLADALSTAAFVLGPERGLELLEAQGVEGLIISADLKKHETKGLYRYRQ